MGLCLEHAHTSESLKMCQEKTGNSKDILFLPLCAARFREDHSSCPRLYGGSVIVSFPVEHTGALIVIMAS